MSFHSWLNTEVDFFLLVSKLLVATGGDEVLVIDLDNDSNSCTLPDFPTGLADAVGGFTGIGPLICSGYHSGDSYGDCYGLQPNGEFAQINELTMKKPRSSASGIVTEDGQLIISGGWNPGFYANEHSDSEIVNVHDSIIENGFVLPKSLREHCSVRINDTTAMILGGYNGEFWAGDLSAQTSTYFVDLVTLQVTNGPDMTIARVSFGCAVFEHKQKKYVIAAGLMSGAYCEDRCENSPDEVLDLETLNWSSSRGNLICLLKDLESS